MSATYLFWQNSQELDPNQDKNWWVVSFALPNDSHNLSFVIENHSHSQSFHYQIERNKSVLEERDIVIPNGRSETITPSITTESDTRTNITVTTQEEKKTIYR